MAALAVGAVVAVLAVGAVVVAVVAVPCTNPLSLLPDESRLKSPTGYEEPNTAALAMIRGASCAVSEE